MYTVFLATSVAVPRERVAWLLRHSLDARLAAGEPQEGSRLVAVRATQLVSVRCRRRVAWHWDALAVQARRPFARSPSDVPGLIQRVADLLRWHQVVCAPGVAIALTMRSLADEAVRRPDTGGDDLVAAIARAAVAAMTARSWSAYGPEPAFAAQNRRFAAGDLTPVGELASTTGAEFRPGPPD